MSKRYIKVHRPGYTWIRNPFPYFFLLACLLLILHCGPKRPAIEKEEEGLIIGKIDFIGTKSLNPKQLKKAMKILKEGDFYNEYKIKVGLENVIYFYMSLPLII